MSFLDKLLRRPARQKAIEYPIVMDWQAGRVAWPTVTYDRLKREGFGANAAVAACVGTHVFTYPEPKPVVKDKNGDPVKATYPLQKLMDRPNPMMSHSALMSLIAMYKAIGGNAYIHQVRNAAGLVVELWPYNDGQMQAVPGSQQWIQSFEYDIGGGKKEQIPIEDILHLKWPVRDPDRPWAGLSPLMQVAREVDSDSEMSRMLYAFLKNDATPRTIISFPEGVNLTDLQKQHLKAMFGQEFGGDNRGRVGYLTGGATIQRLSLNLNELDLSALRGVPEARICAAFRVPPEVAGLTIGMAHSTENNLAAADVRFTQRTLVPLWHADSDEWTSDLAAEFGEYTIEYDTGSVAALQENENDRYNRAINGYDKSVITKNEARAYLGLPPVKDVLALRDFDPDGDVFKANAAPQMPQPNIVDVTPQPAQLTDQQQVGKGYPYPLALKELKRLTTEPIEHAFERELREYLARQYDIAAREVG